MIEIKLFVFTVLTMSEDKKVMDNDTGDNLDNSIDGEFPADGGAQEEDSKDGEGLGASSGSEADLRAKKQRMQTPSPKPSPLPFMVQGIILKYFSNNKFIKKEKNIYMYIIMHLFHNYCLYM